VGIENVEDLAADLAQALVASAKADPKPKRQKRR
jgi:hypothetical protein